MSVGTHNHIRLSKQETLAWPYIATLYNGAASMSEYPIYDFPWDPPHHEKHSRQLSHRSAKNKCMMHGAVVFILLHVFTISPSFPTEQSLQHNRPCIAWVDGMVYLINSGAGSAEAPLAPSYVRRLCMQKLRKS